MPSFFWITEGTLLRGMRRAVLLFADHAIEWIRWAPSVDRGNMQLAS